MKPTTQRFKDLTQDEKFAIVFRYKCGRYYIKDILKIHHITYKTLIKVVEEYELRNQAN